MMWRALPPVFDPDGDLLLNNLNLFSSYPGRELVLTVFSSYRVHNFDLVFYSLVRQLRPQTVVELGVLEGFSLMAMACALRDNGSGHITGYDLFEDYPFRRATFKDVRRRVMDVGLSPYITLHHGAAEDARSCVREVDLLHVDLSNNGDTYRWIFSEWADRVRVAILLEGGSKERDQVHWMRDYNKPGITEALRDLESTCTNWEFNVLHAFPSMTIAFRK